MQHWFKLTCLLAAFPASLLADKGTTLPQLADLPVGITSFGATYHDNAVYVFGGQLGKAHQYSRDEVSQPLYRLKLTPGADWVKLPTDEPALGPSLLSHPSGVIRIGGMQPRNPKGEEAEMFSVPYVRRFDPETAQWSKLPDLPQGRSSHDAFIVGDKIYVAGGWEMRGPGQSSRWAKTVDTLDLSADKPEWRRIPAPFYRRALAIVAHDDQLYCIGGLDNGGDVSHDIDILNLKTEKWSKGPTLPDEPMLGFGTAAGVDAGSGKIYITGFAGNIYTLSDQGDWEKVGKLENGRMFGRFVDPPNATLLILGGAEKGGRPKALEYLPTK